MKILTTILDIATVFLRLLEAEGRILRRAVIGLGWALAFMALAFFLLLGAAGFLLLGIYQYLAAQMTPGAASLLLSALALALALIAAGIAKWRAADPE
jgi:hypothetical protein